MIRSPFHLSARSRPFIGMLILLALVMRAVVPAGFMTVADSHGVHMAFCHGSAPQPHAPTGAPHDGVCPFAASAGAAPIPTFSLAPMAAIVPEHASNSLIQPVAPRAPHRYHAPRGPPASV